MARQPIIVREYAINIPCKNVNSPCAGFTGSAYSCPGHRDLRVSSPPEYEKYKVGDEVNHNDINTLRKALLLELEARKEHSLYSKTNFGSIGTNVNAGDLIDHDQQNVIADCIQKLSRSVNSNRSYGDTTLGTKNVNPDKVNTNNLVETANLKDLEAILTHIATDCICYSDCTNHSAAYTYCSCQGQCGCNY